MVPDRRRLLGLPGMAALAVRPAAPEDTTDAANRSWEACEHRPPASEPSVAEPVRLDGDPPGAYSGTPLVHSFRNAHDLERKLGDFRVYVNHYRVHSSLGGDSPSEVGGKAPRTSAKWSIFRWQSHCRGLYQLPVAA
jgi:transposase InsO family protein